MPPPQNWTITGQAQRVASALAPASSLMLINYDLVNSVYYSSDPGVNPETGVQLEALGSLTVQTDADVWLVSAGPSVIIGAVPGGTQWAPSPALVAAQISALGLATFDEQVNQNTSIPNNISTTGAPLLNLYTLLNGSSGTIGAASSVIKGPYTIGQTSYEVMLEFGTTQNAAIAPVAVEMQWSDSSSGLITATQVYNVYAAYTGAGGQTHQIEGHGPSNADTLTVTLSAPDGAVQYQWALLESSRLYQRHEWRTQNPAGNITFPTLTYASCVPAANILASQATASLASGANAIYLLPFFVGTAQMWFNTSTQVSGGAALLQDQLSALSSATMQRWKSASNGDQTPTSIVLPRDQCQVELLNSTGAAASMTLGIIAQELQTA
jgi:hypothetical protein